MNIQISIDESVKSDLTIPTIDLAAIRQRKRQTAATQGMRIALSKRFPLAFRGFGLPKHPLMIGILEAVLAEGPELRRNQVKAAIGNYVGGRTYLRNMIEGAARFDLNGDWSGQFVTAEAAAIALAKLQKLDAAYGPSRYELTSSKEISR